LALNQVSVAVRN